jgi:hypothetical protein
MFPAADDDAEGVGIEGVEFTLVVDELGVGDGEPVVSPVSFGALVNEVEAVSEDTMVIELFIELEAVSDDAMVGELVVEGDAVLEAALVDVLRVGDSELALKLIKLVVLDVIMAILRINTKRNKNKWRLKKYEESLAVM